MNTKTSHIYGWEDEPVEERPSDFGASSAFYAPSSRRLAGGKTKHIGVRETSGWLTTGIFVVSMFALISMWVLVEMIRIFRP